MIILIMLLMVMTTIIVIVICDHDIVDMIVAIIRNDVIYLAVLCFAVIRLM